MEGDPLFKEEINSELTGLNKADSQRKNQQLIIGLSILSFIVIAALIIIIVVVSTKNGDKNKDKGSPSNLIGTINCLYNVKTASVPTLLLGTEFKIDSSELDIYIDGKKIKYSKEYKFDYSGIHNIQINLYSDINMDFMFKDIKDLEFIEMISENECQITSMISSFENCENLKFFNLTGFKTNQIKSMKKLFYKTALNEFYFNSLILWL